MAIWFSFRKTLKKSPLKKLVTGSLTYTHYKEFADDAATYPRFRKLSGTEELSMEVIDLYELHTEEVENSSPLNSMENLNDKVVILYLESYADDGDLCTALDCDNQGNCAD